MSLKRIQPRNSFFVAAVGVLFHVFVQIQAETAIKCTAHENDTAVDGSVPGTIFSPNFPTEYPKNLQCTWRITAPEGKRVRLVIKNMTFGVGDYMLFRDGIQDDSPQIAKYADCAYGTLGLYSTGRYMLVNFVSDASSLGTGFQLDFESLDSSSINCSWHKDTCLGRQTIENTTFGFLRSLGFPKSLSGNNSRCRWPIKMPTGYRVLLDFLWFAMADKGNLNYCATDALSISVDSLRKSYCGCQPPPRILSLNRTAEIHFSNYQTSNHAGLLAYYRAVGAEECQQGGASACPLNLPRGLGTNRNGDICYEVAVSITSTSSSSSPTTEPEVAVSITSTSSSSSPTTEPANPTSRPTTDDGNPRSGAAQSRLKTVWTPSFLSIMLVVLYNLWGRV